MQNTIEKKLLKSFLKVTISIMAAVIILLLVAMLLLRMNVSSNEAEMGDSAAKSSQELLLTQSVSSNETYVHEKANALNTKLISYRTLLETLSDSAAYVYGNPNTIMPNKEVRKPDEQIALGLTKGNVMEWIPSDSKSDNKQNLAECQNLGSMYGTLDAVMEKKPEIALLYIVSENGYTFGIDDAIEVRKGINEYEARTLDYFIEPIKTNNVYISPVYEDSFGKGSMITMSIPIKVDGKITAVFAADILVGDLKTLVLESTVGDIGGAMLFDHNGELICSSNMSDKAMDSRTTIIDKLAKAESGIFTVADGKDTNYILYSKIRATDWVLAVSVSKGKIIATADASSEEIYSLTKQSLGKLDNIIWWVAIITVLTLLISTIFLDLIVRRVCRTISSPVVKLTREVEQIGDGNLDFTNTIRTGDEIELLGSSFEKMTISLKEYIKNLTSVTAEKERIGAELDVAKHIQASMLPCIFPAFPKRPELDIYATMTPAKEVGGDFYDFFLADDDHLVMVMADVSGKGVPAALFMVIAKTLLKNCAQTGCLSPKEILEKVNNQLCENNEAELFVTVWLGIMEISTGKLIAANAGHEYPVIKRVGGDYELFKDKHGFVLAGMDGSRYKEYELVLYNGDKLYLYTDGVAEATDGDNQLYGTDRMIAALNNNKDANAEDLLRLMKEDIDKFVGSAPQFDDITMLSIELRNQDDSMKKLQLKPTLESVDNVTTFIEQEMEAAEIPMKIAAQMNIAVDEIFSNIVRYSRASDVTIGFKVADGVISLRFADNGIAYDPMSKAEPDITLSAEERDIGGLGIFMVKKSMTSVEYEYLDGLNILVLTKNIT